MTKTCSRCHQTKPVDQFYSDKRSSDGLMPHCKTCHKDYTSTYQRRHKAKRRIMVKNWRRRNPEKVAEYHKRSHEKRCNDPHYRAAAVRRANKAREKRKHNPVKWAAYLKQARERYHRIKNNPVEKEKRRLSKARYNASERGKHMNRLAVKRHKERYPDHTGARKYLFAQMKAGKIKRPSTCENCGNPCTPEAHHHKGYARKHWTDVRWLCRPCHRHFETLIGFRHKDRQHN